MMLTVSNVTEEMQTRITGYLEKATAITGEEKSPSIQSCMTWAARQLGVATTQLRSMTDEELSAVANVDAFLDLTELRMLETVQTNLSDVTVQVGPVREDWNDLSSRIALLIKQKRASIGYQHGIALDFSMGAEQLKSAYIRNL